MPDILASSVQFGHCWNETNLYASFSSSFLSLFNLPSFRIYTPRQMPIGRAEYLWTNTRQRHNGGSPRIYGQQNDRTTGDRQHRTLYTRQTTLSIEEKSHGRIENRIRDLLVAVNDSVYQTKRLDYLICKKQKRNLISENILKKSENSKIINLTA